MEDFSLGPNRSDPSENIWAREQLSNIFLRPRCGRLLDATMSPLSSLIFISLSLAFTFIVVCAPLKVHIFFLLIGSHMYSCATTSVQYHHVVLCHVLCFHPSLPWYGDPVRC